MANLPPMRLKLLGAAVLAVLGIGAVVVVVFRPGSASAAGAQYLTAAVTREDVTDDVAANGTLGPVTRYGLQFGSAPQVLTSSSSSSSSASSAASSSGTTSTWPVTIVKVSIGQSVKKGAVLATADSASVSEQLAQLANQLTVAQIQLAQASADLDAATTDQQTRQAQISYYNAKNQVAQLTSQKADTNAQLSRAQITAPADGIVEAINIVAGADAPSGSAIVLDSGGLQASVTIAEADLSRVSIGQAASVSITAIDANATGKVASISPTAESGSGNSSVVSYAVTVSLTNVPTTARGGMTASVSVTISQAKNVLAVPAIALVNGSNGYTVRVMGSDGSITSQPVTVGLVTSTLAEVKSGLTAGQEVVIGVSNSQTSTGTTNAGGLGGLGGALGGGAGGARFPNGGGTQTR
ncbi:MAG: efflux RND transporter periplasmic adaptor subunit [Chloroflexota bacterium]|nr:efflux RND transporter periplasmic adaptor subunit [Chloroflexota bacterium]